MSGWTGPWLQEITLQSDRDVLVAREVVDSAMKGVRTVLPQPARTIQNHRTREISSQGVADGSWTQLHGGCRHAADVPVQRAWPVLATRAEVGEQRLPSVRARFRAWSRRRRQRPGSSWCWYRPVPAGCGHKSAAGLAAGQPQNMHRQRDRQGRSHAILTVWEDYHSAFILIRSSISQGWSLHGLCWRPDSNWVAPYFPLCGSVPFAWMDARSQAML